MNSWRLILNSLNYYRRTNAATALGILIAAAVLTGALAVGDAMRANLRAMASARLGNIEYAAWTGERLFRSALAEAMAGDLDANVIPVLSMEGSAVRPDGSARANRVNVLGIDSLFSKLDPSNQIPSALAAGEVYLNQRLALQLSARANDVVLLKVERPSAMPRDAAAATLGDSMLSLRVQVRGILPDSGLGRFGLQSNQVPPYNAFVSISWLQEQLGVTGRANTLLAASRRGKAMTAASIQEALRRNFQMEDAQWELLPLKVTDGTELRSERVFLDSQLAIPILNQYPQARGVLTYFVKSLSHGSFSTPYSMVSGLETADFMPPDLANDEIIVNQWLADDLQIKPGDEIKICYDRLEPARMLREATATFRIRSIVPMEGEAKDPELMPSFPGIADVENCREWNTGFYIDLNRIRPRDEDYWNQYHGTPKAFTALKTAQALWGNRYGEITAIRFEGPISNADPLRHKLNNLMNPGQIGLVFRPVRDEALASVNASQDFGQLFIGFSFFLIISALILTAMQFRLGVEQRTRETGIFLALGFQSRQVRRYLLIEGLGIAIIGSLPGAILGIAYTRLVLRGLSTLWVDAVGTPIAALGLQPATIIAGMLSTIIAAFIAMWITLIRRGQWTPRQLLYEGFDFETVHSGKPVFHILAAMFLLIFSILLVFQGFSAEGQTAAVWFFGSGFLLLATALTLTSACLKHWSRSNTNKTATSFLALSLSGAARRRGRSVATIALLAFGSFVIIAIGANRHDPIEHARERSSGTGGFTLFAESTQPVYRDLNTTEVMKDYGIPPDDLNHVEFVSFRVRSGDDASCLNLNRTLNPRLLGVSPEALASRQAFTFVKTLDKDRQESPWRLLEMKYNDGTIPVVGDEPTITWSLGKSLGDIIVYTDDLGHEMPVRIAGILASSVFQGNLILSEDYFIQHFPSTSGYQTFLIDAPETTSGKVAEILSEGFQDLGFEVVPAARRLAEFNRVENTYLSIFQALGGLGLLLGTAGLGMVVLRNVLERRGELALLEAVGYRRRRIHRLLLLEHGFLSFCGLACGILCGLIAVLPSLMSPKAEIPFISLSLTLATITLSSLFWTWLATSYALRGSFLDALRNE